MIGIAAVFGAVSIFAADFWLKSQASQRVETRTIEVQAPAEPKVQFKTIVVASRATALRHAARPCAARRDAVGRRMHCQRGASSTYR